jgi:phospholipase/lecithinase/hemolysin
VEFLANRLGLNANPANNYASGGSTSGTANVANGVFNTNKTLLGLLSQVEEFTTAYPAADPNALYIVEVGRLDYLIQGQTDTAPVINNLSNAIAKLSTVGARNIAVANLLDLGKIPAGSESPSSSSLSNLTNQHNRNLATSLQTLDAALDSNITLLDFNSLLNEIINEPGKFGFTNVTNTCLSSPGFLTPPFTVCSNPNDFLYWDTQHTTVPAQILFADLAFTALQSDIELKTVPEPSPLLAIFMTAGFCCLLQIRFSRKKFKRTKRSKLPALVSYQLKDANCSVRNHQPISQKSRQSISSSKVAVNSQLLH